ncbi:nucleotidyltransferase domain-containing protein [Brevibacillus sp. 179-C 1.1 NHS]|uniref:nucleotidyltransferase domain-containing protein n=1 Tax=Brevibacillus sp. 179-C 1.1 NHS TaxID=3235177 RepID=UPI0039A17D5B
MRETILEKLNEIEQEHELKILFAVESGSRAWGFPSKDSDYDVRFVYVKKPEWYLSIDDKRDVVEVPINDLLDINGWDIRKALKLFRKSNPPLQEWLVSDIVYHDSLGFRDELIMLREEVFSPKASLHHYLSMAKGNFRDYLHGDQVKIKKYFYVLRPILACIWIEKYNANPPIGFERLVSELVTDSSLKDKISELLRRKMAGDELDLEPRIDMLHHFIEEQIERLTVVTSQCTNDLLDPTDKLDEVFRKYLQKAWSGPRKENEDE